MDELPQTHIERMDVLAFEKQQELQQLNIREAAETERVKIRHKIAKQETWRYFWVGLFITSAVLSIIAATYFGISSSQDGVDENHEKYLACVNNGGSWIPESGSDDGFCIIQGKESTK